MRIGSVDIYKFFFSWIICLYHFYNAVWPNPHFPSGEVVVELFVLVSGVFLFMGWERKKARCLNGGGSLGSDADTSPYTYLKRRFLRFLPYVVIGFVLAFGVRAWLFVQEGNPIHLRQVLNWLSEDVWEILMVKMNGMNNDAALLNVPAWTVSAMLIAEFIIFSLLVNWEKVFTTLICPIVILFTYGYWRHLPKANHDIWIGYTTFGLLRVFALICLSWYCWQLVKRLQQTRFTKAGSVLLGISEWLLYAVSVVLLMNFDSRYMRWVITMLFFLAVAISISGASFTLKVFPQSKLSRWMGEMSMGIYLTHYPIMRVFKHLWPNAREMFRYKFVYLAVVFAASVLFCELSKLLVKATALAVGKLKAVAVQTEAE